MRHRLYFAHYDGAAAGYVVIIADAGVEQPHTFQDEVADFLSGS